MVMDYLPIGCAPTDEDCVQISRDKPYRDAMEAELKRYKAGLERYFAEQMAGTSVRLRIKWYPHDFGEYGEVEAAYDDKDRASAQVAFLIEGNTPCTWDDLENETYQPDQEKIPCGS